jgi:cation-transporting ATPase E
LKEDNKIIGLTSAQVKNLKEAGKNNFSVKAPSKTNKEIIKENTLTYFNLVFLVIAILLILVGSFRDLTFLPIILANTLIGIIQEIRSKRVLDKLTMLNAPTAIAIRDGEEIEVKAEDLVLGDIVVFKAGDQICADAIVIDGKAMVNESLLTGESDEIAKTKDSELMSGSFIVSGKCFARLTKVGGRFLYFPNDFAS